MAGLQDFARGIGVGRTIIIAPVLGGRAIIAVGRVVIARASGPRRIGLTVALRRRARIGLAVGLARGPGIGRRRPSIGRRWGIAAAGLVVVGAWRPVGVAFPAPARAAIARLVSIIGWGLGRRGGILVARLLAARPGQRFLGGAERGPRQHAHSHQQAGSERTPTRSSRYHWSHGFSTAKVRTGRTGRSKARARL